VIAVNSLDIHFFNDKLFAIARVMDLFSDQMLLIDFHLAIQRTNQFGFA